MIATALISLLGLAQIPLDGPPTVRTVVVPVSTCPSCGIRLSTVTAAINRLRSSPRPNDRENAAESLREIRPKCHPEVVDALSNSLLRDPAPSVRREAAESLTRLAVARPESHASLAFAASRDPNPFVRHQAVKGLKARRGRCPTDCPICGPTALPTRGDVVIEERVAPDVISKTSPTPNPFTAPLPESIPPPRPTPAPFGTTRAVPAPPAPEVIVSTPRTADPVVRRSSAKPIEGPTQVMPPVIVSPKPVTPRPSPTSAPAPATKPSTPSDFPPLEAPAG